MSIERIQRVLAQHFGLDRSLDTLRQWGVTGNETDQEIAQIYRDWWDEVTL